MDDSSRSIEARVADLERRIQALEQLSTVNSQVSDLRLPTSDFPAESPGGNPAAFDLVAVLTLTGRTFVVLGGAYLLRALTESGMLPVPVGVALGFAYAATWLAAADRTASNGFRLSALFHGLSASMIALPLLWEAVTRFGLLGGPSASFALVTIVGAVLAVAVRVDLQALAWVIVGGSVTTSIALTAATGFVRSFAVADIAVGVATLWVGYTFDWIWLRWAPALVANVAVFALAAGASTGAAGRPPQIIATQLLLLTGYLGSIAVRTLVRGREVNLFEVVQGTAALAVGFGGAVYVAQTTRVGAGPLAAIGAICSAGCYGVAFAFVARRQGLRRNFYFYTSVGLILALATTATAVGPAALVWAMLAVPTAWTAARARHFTLSLHAAIYIVAAAIASGLLTSATRALVGDAAAAAGLCSPALLAVFAAGCVCWAAPPPAQMDALGRFARFPRLTIAVVLTWWTAAALVVTAAQLSADPGFIATARTTALAVAAIALAALGRSARFIEAGWLVYPLLVAGGAKLVAEDLPRSRPATLFAALAVYGGALILAPRLARRRVPGRSGEEQPPPVRAMPPAGDR